MKKIMCVLGTAVLIASMAFAGSAAADDHSCGENLTWFLDYDGLLTISGTGEMDSFIEKDPPWGHLSVRNVIIEPGVTSIGTLAFANCVNLKSIEIADTVTSIGDYAFDRCSYLKSVSLPDSVREIGVNPFSGCRKLKEIGLSDDHPVFSFRDGMLICKPEHHLICRAAGCEIPECIVPAEIQTIGEEAFSECVALETVSIPEGVATIGRRTFFNCSNLMTVDLPSSLTTIGNGAFSNCEWLKHISLREGLRSIGKAAFDCCRRLEELTLPDSLEELGDRPFDICQSLSRINVSADHPYLAFENGILYSKPDQKLIFYAAQNPAVTCVIPQGIRIIGQRAFGNGGDLRDIILPESVREIEKEGFHGCRNVEEIMFSRGLETIGSLAFEDMDRLEEVVLPDGLKTIGDEAFGGCSGLKSILIPDSVETLGKNIFAGTDTLNLTVFASAGSAAERYCRENGLKTVLPGEEIPGAETELPAAFAEQYPGYKGLYRMDGKTENERIYLAERPDGALVLLCGVPREGSGWSTIESATLPAESRVILDDGLRMLDLGYARCTVRRYYDDVWGIDCVGWKDGFIGPRWVGSYGPPRRQFGNHPWGDLRTISWISLDESVDVLVKAMDYSAFATPNQADPEGRTPICASPDSDSREIALLRNGAPLFVSEKDGEWTHVSFGRDDGKTWKMDGWVRTDDLVFGEKADTIVLTDPDYHFFTSQIGTFSFITPDGSRERPCTDYNPETWFVIGEEVIDGRECWLVYDCYTEELGFIPKSSLH